MASLEQCLRTGPISPPARELLLGLIAEEPILLSLKTDGRILLQKREAWAKITEKFNAHNMGPQRSEVQLKKVWEQLKVKAKKSKADLKREVFKTGGGAPPPDMTSDCEQVLTLLGDDINDIGNPYDDDALPSQPRSDIWCELVSSEPLAPTPDEEQGGNKVGETIVPASPVRMTSRQRRAGRWKAGEDVEVREIVKASTSRDDEFQNKRAKLMDMQLRYMELKLEEAEARKEEAKEKALEAKMYRLIAEKEHANCT
ncbi:uncharacterized protein LOC126990388 isoform X2 [Eriocheir sinensis]|uniref:uncharacterized protein LOC126990388 isoform X2 n=1 Tax=Eriocheir sinensis TaxID=95602 RepID=UPI0021CA8643|nr:uncharacterized protein LOC126990388 isoform X2 [Eriocheir sinensis]